MLVVVQNSYAAATVTVEAGQQVVSSGLYGLVRHPMYVGNVIMMVGIPLALGSYWGLVMVVPGMWFSSSAFSTRSEHSSPNWTDTATTRSGCTIGCCLRVVSTGTF